ncbi:MAG: hypothetical protein HYS04_16915, partial [Acidobacteria bacterium]|nr:hypothetical protein [Acidobacteriota bacterium]
MRYLPYIYFLRVPLLCSLALLGLPLAAVPPRAPARALLAGMFDVDPAGAALVTFLALSLAATLSIAADLVLRYGRMRFFAAPLPARLTRLGFTMGPLAPSRISAFFIVYFAVCAIVLIVAGVIGPEAEGWMPRALAALAGAVAFVVFLRLVAALWAATPAERTGWIARRLRFSASGYLAGESDGGEWRWLQPPRLLAGHGLALLMLAASLIMYGIFGVARYAVLSGWTAPLVRLALPPTLGSVLVLMIMLVWIFSGAAYFFDRYRVPV